MMKTIWENRKNIQKIGYKVIETEAKKQKGIEKLQKQLKII